MTTLVLSHLFNDAAAALTRLGDRFRLFVDGIEDACAKARLFQSLTRLSDTELERRGLKRADIARVVFTDAHRG